MLCITHKVHLVLATRWRRPASTGPMLKTAEITIRERCILRGRTARRVRCGGGPHSCAGVVAALGGTAAFVNAVKTTTSLRLRRDFPPRPGAWGTLCGPPVSSSPVRRCAFQQDQGLCPGARPPGVKAASAFGGSPTRPAGWKRLVAPFLGQTNRFPLVLQHAAIGVRGCSGATEQA